MPQPLIAPLPPNLDLADGYVVRFNALDPATGAQVTGVLVSNALVYVYSDTASSPQQLESGPFTLLPAST